MQFQLEWLSMILKHQRVGVIATASVPTKFFSHRETRSHGCFGIFELLISNQHQGGWIKQPTPTPIKTPGRPKAPGFAEANERPDSPREASLCCQPALSGWHRLHFGNFATTYVTVASHHPSRLW